MCQYLGSVAQACPQGRIVADAPMPQAVEDIDTVVDVPVPQVLEELQEQIVEVVLSPASRRAPQERSHERVVKQSLAFCAAEHGASGARRRPDR